MNILKISRLLIFILLFLKKSHGDIKSKFSMQISKKPNIPGSEGTFLHLKERPSNQLVQLFFKLHGTPIENKSFFSL